MFYFSIYIEYTRNALDIITGIYPTPWHSLIKISLMVFHSSSNKSCLAKETLSFVSIRWESVASIQKEESISRHIFVPLLCLQWRIQACWETSIPVWVLKLAPKRNFSNFLFQLYFNKKYVEIAINHFTRHLIISKWLRKPKCGKKRKKVDEKVEAKEQAVYESVSIPLNTNRSHECSPFLQSKLFTNTSLCDSFYTTCCIFSGRFADLATL